MLSLGLGNPRPYRLAALAAIGLCLYACGPSVQYRYESQLRFEHCYRLDFDPTIVSTHRKACWEDWLTRFTKDQTRDRVEYAKRRIDSLARGERGPLTLELATVDAGTSAVDAGTPAADAGTPAADAGTPAADAGTPAADAGTAILDAGMPTGAPVPARMSTNPTAPPRGPTGLGWPRKTS